MADLADRFVDQAKIDAWHNVIGDPHDFESDVPALMEYFWRHIEG